MEELIDTKHGSTVLLAILVALFAIHLIWKVYEEKDKKTEKSLKEYEDKLARFTNLLSSYVHTAIELNDKLKSVDGKLAEIIEFNDKIERAIRHLAGDDWEDLKKKIDDEDLMS